MITLMSCSNKENEYGYVDLGDNFYYIEAPSYFDCICHSTSSEEPWTPASHLIQNIDKLGFNGSFILAVSANDLGLEYWIIDKTQNTRRVGFRYNSRLITSNLQGPVDSLNFMNFKQENSIELQSKSYFSERLKYD